MKVEAANRLTSDGRAGEPQVLEGSSEVPMYSLPQGHNLDDGMLKTGIDCDPEEAPSEPVSDPGVPELNAATRLVSMQNIVEADKYEDSQSDSDIARTLKRVSDSE